MTMLHERIKEARKKAKLTQEQLANEIGVKRAVISKYENGMIEPSLKQLQAIADALKCDPAWLQWNESIDDREQSVINTVRLLNLQDEYDQRIAEVATQRMEYEFKCHGYSFSDDEKELVKHLSKLNANGWQKAIERVEELEEIPKYTKRFDQITSQEREAMKSANSWDDVYRILTNDAVPADLPTELSSQPDGKEG